MRTQLLLVTILIAAPVWVGCGSDEEFTCVCTNTVTGDEIERSTVVAGDINEAQDECDSRESIAFPDRCVIEE